MENLRLSLVSRTHPEHPLVTGVHRVVREASGLLSVADGAQGALLAQFCMDRRGLWLQVVNNVRGIHVNGRPVQRMALIRAGDAVYVEGTEILVQASCQAADAIPPARAEDEGDPRIVLRGVGGKHHGRSFNLSQPCLVGAARAATIRIDEEGFAERHAQLERRGDRVWLHDVSGKGSKVNGVQVRDALLAAGDQVAFGHQHRFVVEVPWLEPAQVDGDRSAGGDDEQALDAPAPGPRHSIKRWPWLLLAALLLAAALSALLLFGAG